MNELDVCMQYDLDGDGIIDASEFRLTHAAKIDFTRLDKDGGDLTVAYWYRHCCKTVRRLTLL